MSEQIFFVSPQENKARKSQSKTLLLLRAWSCRRRIPLSIILKEPGPRR